MDIIYIGLLNQKILYIYIYIYIIIRGQPFRCRAYACFCYATRTGATAIQQEESRRELTRNLLSQDSLALQAQEAHTHPRGLRASVDNG